MTLPRKFDKLSTGLIAGFLLFNHFEMLRSSRGVLGITIAWAALVFGIKLLI